MLFLNKLYYIAIVIVFYYMIVVYVIRCVNVSKVYTSCEFFIRPLMYDVADFAFSTAKPVTVLKKKIEYLQLLSSVVSVSSFYGN